MSRWRTHLLEAAKNNLRYSVTQYLRDDVNDHSTYTNRYAKPAHRHSSGFGSASKVSINESVMSVSWYRRGQEQVDLSEFTDEGDYTPAQLEAYADAILRADAKESKPIGVYPSILFEEHLYNRRRREILCEQGYPDEALTGTLSRDGQMIFNRTHPQGRKVNSEKARRENGASYYRS